MAWTSLSFAFGSVLTSAKMTNLYDDITAQANGDTGAPKNQTASYQDDSVTGAKIQSPVAGTTYVICRWADGEVTNASQTIVTPVTTKGPYIVDGENKELIGLTVLVSGVVTVSVELKANDVFRASWIRILVNGSTVTSDMGQANTTYVTHTRNITVNQGDLIQVIHFLSGGAGVAFRRNLQIKSGNNTFAVA